MVEEDVWINGELMTQHISPQQHIDCQRSIPQLVTCGQLKYEMYMFLSTVILGGISREKKPSATSKGISQ